MEDGLLTKFRQFVGNLIQGARLLFDISLLVRSRTRNLVYIGEEMLRDPNQNGLTGSVAEAVHEVRIIEVKIREREENLEEIFRRQDQPTFDWAS